MKREEFASIVAAIKAHYQMNRDMFNDENVIETWYQHLKDIDYKTLQISTSKWVMMSRYPPTVADLREMAQDVQYGELPDWSSEWLKVLEAISYYGQYREQEALASLNDITRTVVSRMGFKNLCWSEEPSVDRANFRNIYCALAEREKKERMLSAPIRKAIQNAQESRRERLETKRYENMENDEKCQENDPRASQDRIRELVGIALRNIE